MDIRSEIIDHQFEQVAFFTDVPTGILCIVAIHSTVLGPSLGGCRMLEYHSSQQALSDVLRLAEGMTYKNSLAGLNLGGGKSVIVAPREMSVGRTELFERFGLYVKSLGGKYYTAEDMGTSVQDMNAILRQCPYVAGRDQSVGGGGDPSPWTALGVFEGIRACLLRTFGNDTFKGRHVVVQGSGHVGAFLAERLVEAGATITLSDTRPAVLERLSKRLHAKAVSPADVYSVECDVFAPCAVGAILNQQTVPQFKTRIIAGAANNQLADQSIETMLTQRGIVYAPDFAINAGGVILCADELEPGGFTPTRVEERVKRIFDTVGSILDEAQASGKSAGQVAVDQAQARIARVRAEQRGQRKT